MSVVYTQGDGDVVFRSMSIPAGFRRHLVGKTPRKVRYCEITQETLFGQVDDHGYFLKPTRVSFI